MCNSSKNRELNYFPTPEWVSKKLAAALSLHENSQIVDLGAGSGNLVKAIKLLRPGIVSIGVETDEEHMNVLMNICDSVIRTDLLETSLKDIYRFARNGNVIVSNPPYSTVNLTTRLKNELIKIGFISEKSLARKTRSEIVFLANAIKGAPFGTQFAFIMPISILTSEKYKLVRLSLIRTSEVNEIIVLPANTFRTTEAKTVILIFTNDGSIQKDIPVKVHENSMGYRSTYITQDDFIDGLIYSSEKEANQTLGKLINKLSRGKSSSKSLKQRSIEHIHSSHLNYNKTKYIKAPISDVIDDYEHFAEPGDILVSRVGSRCYGKVAILKDNPAVISDCVIRVQVSSKHRNKAFDYLTSRNGQKYLHETSSGTCAKILTYKQLMSFPINY